MTNPDYEMHLRPEEDYEMHFDDAGLKPEQTATVTPGYETQTVRPDPGCVFSEVTVEAIPEPTEEIDITENGTVDVAKYGTANVAVPVGVFPEGTENITENGDYDVTLKETAHVEVVPDLQDKTVTPTEQTQTIEADAGYDGIDTVTVNPIPPEYVVPTGSVDITQNGQVSVSGKATANVNVPGIIPTGTKQINITANGTTTEDVTNYAGAEITVNTLPEKGLIFEDYDSDGYPTELYSKGMDNIPAGLMAKLKKVTINEGVRNIGVGVFAIAELNEVVLPQSLETCDGSAFRNANIINLVIPPLLSSISVTFNSGNNKLKSVLFQGNVTRISRYAFENSGATDGVVFDFRNCTSVPVLENANAFAAGKQKTFIVKQELLSTWQNETNWVAVTNVTWEGV